VSMKIYASNKIGISADLPLNDWLVAALFKARGLANMGAGDRAGEIIGLAHDTLLQSTPREHIEAALTFAERKRPPRAEGTAREGRYASLAITALEEAGHWERDREASATSARATHSEVATAT
jgi:hypothetical protein